MPLDPAVPGLDRYFDHAAAAPPFPEALEAEARAARTWYANPSSAHAPGRAARAELDRLRARLAGLCGFSGGRLVLTSGATEANNWVVQGVLAAFPDARVLVAEDVHPSIWNACARQHHRRDVLGLDPGGRILLPALLAAIGPATRLVCCSHASNETGVIHDAGAIAAACERRGVLCLVDGVQALGRIPVDLSAVGSDFYVFASHKFGGPRGCGGAFVRADGIGPILDGGAQEWGLRPGTENLGALAGAVAALEMSRAALDAEAPRLRGLARLLLDELGRLGTAFVANGDPGAGLPGFASLSFEGLEGGALAADLSVQGFAVGVGSACSSDRPEPSRAILALGRPPAVALGTIRISLGRTNGAEAVLALARAVAGTVERHRREA